MESNAKKIPVIISEGLFIQTKLLYYRLDILNLLIRELGLIL